MYKTMPFKVLRISLYNINKDSEIKSHEPNVIFVCF